MVHNGPKGPKWSKKALKAHGGPKRQKQSGLFMLEEADDFDLQMYASKVYFFLHFFGTPCTTRTNFPVEFITSWKQCQTAAVRILEVDPEFVDRNEGAGPARTILTHDHQGSLMVPPQCVASLHNCEHLLGTHSLRQVQVQFRLDQSHYPLCFFSL